MHISLLCTNDVPDFIPGHQRSCEHSMKEKNVTPDSDCTKTILFSFADRIVDSDWHCHGH